MTSPSGINWEDAFANGAYIAKADSFPALWAKQSAEHRQKSNRAQIDLPYGKKEREKLDLFLPDDTAKGLFVFVHGGFWKAFDKSYWSHLANGALEKGYAVAIPSYTLAPAATLPEMTQQIAKAIGTVSDIVPGPIFLAGHSAGGHLVTRMVCEDSPLARAILDRLINVVSISGLHDLRPLLLNSMNNVLGLVKETAISESSALKSPVGGAKVTALVGNLERPEFLRQSSLLVESWATLSTQAELVVVPGCHHFNVIDGLQNPSSTILQILLKPQKNER
ncbi:MAG: alpha/beta hydrolase [Rhodobacteraceae bacterium]|nr:alpha/beta hydrolase [Paracoccaceae bacterium]